MTTPKKATKKKPRKIVAKVQIELDIELIVSKLLEGDTFRSIAEYFNSPLSSLHAFCSLPEHSARVDMALKISADSFSDKAEQVLIDAESDKNEIQRARELAQHYRWKAAKRAPHKYGDKLDVTSDNKPLTMSAKVEIIHTKK